VRKTLSALPMLLGLLVGLTASKALAQQSAYFGPGSTVGFADAGPSSGGSSNPFVPEDSASSSKKKIDFAQKPAPTAGSDSKSEPASNNGASGSPSCGCGEGGQACGCGEACPSCGCAWGCGCVSGCDACPPYGLVLFGGVESFRNIANRDYQNNDGLRFGANLGVPLPVLRDYGFGGQIGGSFGAYHLDGRTFPDGDPTIDPNSALSDVEQQYFITIGIFHHATENFPLNMGFGHDWMIADAYGALATSPWLDQWRGQIGYAISDWNELGVWSALHGRGDGKVVTLGGVATDIGYRAIDQCNFFWHHNYDSGADSWLWMGFLENEKIGGSGSLGEYTVGARMQVPLTERVALYAEAEYMRPSAAPGVGASMENAFSVGFGLAFFPNGSSKNRTVAGSCWMPVLPVANNGTFLIDSTLPAL